MTKRTKWLYILGTLFFMVILTVMICSAAMGVRYWKEHRQGGGIFLPNAPGWFQDWAGGISGDELNDWLESLPEDWLESLPEEMPEGWPEEIPEDWLETLPDIGDLFGDSDGDVPGWLEEWIESAGGEGTISGDELGDWLESLPEDWLESLPEKMPEEWPEEFPEEWLETLPDIGDLLGGGAGSVPGWFEEWIKGESAGGGGTIPGDILDGWLESLPEDWLESLPEEMPEGWPEEFPEGWLDTLPDIGDLLGGAGSGLPGWFEEWINGESEDGGGTIPDGILDGWLGSLPEDWIEGLPEEMPEGWPEEFPEGWLDSLPDIGGVIGGGGGSGSGWGEGSDIFGGDMDTSGDIGVTPTRPGTGGSGTKFIPVTIYSDATEQVYLRYGSYGDYHGRYWSKPAAWETEWSMNYLPAYTLAAQGYAAHTMELTVYGSQYLLPYYPETGSGTHRQQEGDTFYSGSTAEPYTVTYYTYDLLAEGECRYSLTGTAAAREKEYRSYVYEQYLQVPAETLAYLRQIIAEQDLDANDADIVGQVARYIQSAAVYNMNYDSALNAEQDIVVSFLRDYREGICQHYASAATLLYRALGIPARYTCGYVGYTRAGQYVNVTSDNAHAWVEIYLDGFGWVQIEVTGSPANEPDEDPVPGGDVPGGGVPDEGGVIAAQSITVRTLSGVKQYDGTALTAETYEIAEGELLPGHTLVLRDWSAQTAVGKTDNDFKRFAVLDEKGNDVTAYYYIGKELGTLEVQARKIVVTTASATASYGTLNGKPLRAESWTEEGLLPGHRLEVTFTGEQMYPGKSSNTVQSIAIFDEKGNDVTANYAIEIVCGTLRVVA